MLDVLILRVARAATLILAAIVAYLALRSHRRGGGRMMLFLSGGFFLISIGAIASGLLYEIFGSDLALAYTVESFFAATGLAIIVYSIYAPRKGSSAKKITRGD